MQTSYVFLAVGNNHHIHNQAKYAIISLMAHKSESSNIFIVTDHPQNYAWFGEHLNYIKVLPSEIQAWQGAAGYFFRIKIKALQQVLSKINGNLVYLDADIFCLKNLVDFEQRVDNGDFFMHTREFALCAGPTKTAKQMWRAGKGKVFGSILIDQHSVMWNSGVIALPAGSAAYLQTALTACDTMCQSTMRPYFVEQFAMGLALTQSQRLFEAKDWFLHYWGNKMEWQQK